MKTRGKELAGDYDLGLGGAGYTHHNVFCTMLLEKCMLHWQWHIDQTSVEQKLVLC